MPQLPRRLRLRFHPLGMSHQSFQESWSTCMWNSNQSILEVQNGLKRWVSVFSQQHCIKPVDQSVPCHHWVPQTHSLQECKRLIFWCASMTSPRWCSQTVQVKLSCISLQTHPVNCLQHVSCRRLHLQVASECRRYSQVLSWLKLSLGCSWMQVSLQFIVGLKTWRHNLINIQTHRLLKPTVYYQLTVDADKTCHR